MNVKSTVTGFDGTTTYIFHKTPIMSPYLLAMAVGPYEYIEEKTNTGLPIRIYAYPHQIEHCKFALEVAVKVSIKNFLFKFKLFFDLGSSIL